MNALAYLHLQMQLEGIGLTDGQLLSRLPVAEEAPPLVLIAHLATGKLVSYLNATLPSHLRTTLLSALDTITFPQIDPLLHLLRAAGLEPQTGHYRTYRFPKPFARVTDDLVHCYSKHNPLIDAFGFGNLADNVYAIVQESKIVSACVSVRENDHCGEAWVMTAPAYRRQGLARRVVSGWAASLLNAGKAPFYSHKSDNCASARLAMRLGLELVFEEISVTLTPV